MQVTGNRRFRVLLTLISAVLVAAVGLGLGWTWGHASAPVATAAPSVYTVTAHGPRSIVAGVPSGFTRDRPGAVSAAVAWVQTAESVRNQKADPVRAATMLAATATQAAKDELAGYSSGSVGGASIQMPLAFQVRSYTDSDAQVGVWVCGTTVASAGANAPNKGASTCMTRVITETWADDDWRVSDLSWTWGPDFDEFNTLADTAGYEPVTGALTVLID